MSKKILYAIISGSVFFIVSLFLSSALFSKVPNADLSFAIPMAIIGIPLYWVVGYVVSTFMPALANSLIFSAIIGIISVTIQWSIVGYIIGWVIEKNKATK